MVLQRPKQAPSYGGSFIVFAANVQSNSPWTSHLTRQPSPLHDEGSVRGDFNFLLNDLLQRTSPVGRISPQAIDLGQALQASILTAEAGEPPTAVNDRSNLLTPG